ncbi:MAG: hypothetical protein C4330_06875 [Chitinophagaceae bacterium]
MLNVLKNIDKQGTKRIKKIKEKQEAELKTIGPAIRTADEPTHINALMRNAFIIDMTKMRKSG